MRKQKILGTNTAMPYDMLEKLRALRFTGYHNQFRIVCKCTSMTDANKKCKAVGLNESTFRTGWCCETGNPKEIEAVSVEDIAICIDGTLGQNYITVKELLQIA